MKGSNMYNVHCTHCGAIFQVQPKSSLWWKARKRAQSGYLDALSISGQECGCVEKIRDPEAPYRVTGFSFDCDLIDIPFRSFTCAVKSFLRLNKKGASVFISGINSSRVKARLDSV